MEDITMKSKRWFQIPLVVVIIVCIFSGVVFAINNDKPDATPTISGISIDAELSLTNNTELQNIVTAVKLKKLPMKDFYKQMLDYALFLKVYQPQREEVSYINRLTNDGCELDKLIEIYSFWLDTDEDITFIKTLYDAADFSNNKSEHWVEAAFNKVTEGKYGVLNQEQIKEYYAKGISRDDIIAANRLSRRGKDTIDEILDKKVSDIPWIDIIEDIYNRLEKKEKIYIDQNSLGEYKEITNGVEILEAIFLSQVNGKHLNDYLSKLAKGRSISTEINQYITEQTRGIYDQLKVQGLWDESPEIKEKNEEARQALRSKLLQNGISERKIDELKRQGNTELDILNAINLSQKHNTSLEKVINAKNKGITWQELTEKGVQ